MCQVSVSPVFLPRIFSGRHSFVTKQGIRVDPPLLWAADYFLEFLISMVWSKSDFFSGFVLQMPEDAGNNCPLLRGVPAGEYTLLLN